MYTHEAETANCDKTKKIIDRVFKRQRRSAKESVRVLTPFNRICVIQEDIAVNTPDVYICVPENLVRFAPPISLNRIICFC
jgi:hypothetical protein